MIARTADIRSGPAGSQSRCTCERSSGIGYMVKTDRRLSLMGLGLTGVATGALLAMRA